MAGRRQNRGRGDGSITLRKDGRYEIRLKDPQTGKRRSAYASTEAAARRKLREMVTRAVTGDTVLDATATVKQYSEQWLDNDAGRTRAASTVREYERRLNKYVIPRIGNVRLNALTVIQVERMLEAMAGDELSRSSIIGCRNALSAMLADAVLARHVRTNVAVRARVPPVEVRPARPVATPEQAIALLEEAAGTDLYELLVLVAFTGCRIGEALGARWCDIDAERGEWLICRTTTLDAQGHVIVGERTKTGEPRLAYLQPPAVKALNSQRANVAAARLKAGRHWQDHELIFPSSVGTAQDSRNLRKDMRALADKVGFPGSFHQLRHLFATVAASNVTLTALSKVMGHRRAATTADLYAHLYDRDASAASAAIAAALDSGTEG